MSICGKIYEAGFDSPQNGEWVERRCTRKSGHDGHCSHRGEAAAEMGRARSEAKARAARENGKKGGRPRHTDHDRVISLGIPRGLDREGESCPTCGELAHERQCDVCGLTAYIIDCGHYAQPRPIADGVCANCA